MIKLENLMSDDKCRLRTSSPVWSKDVDVEENVELGERLSSESGDFGPYFILKDGDLSALVKTKLSKEKIAERKSFNLTRFNATRDWPQTKAEWKFFNGLPNADEISKGDYTIMVT